ncbi:hypothetical protein [Megamonas hypermegale]|uniref:hypothetical protein n=1 Tax=Megamonas hypermegale TaxID=158847 RepID=UPI0026ED0B49|nr:hypothetical protein [Megamonas hypermegale]
MNKLQKMTLTLGAVCTVIASSSICLASGTPKSVVPAANIPYEEINTKVDIHRNDQDITPVIARNIPDEKINTKVNMHRNDQDITPVPATHIPDEEIDTSVPWN